MRAGDKTKFFQENHALLGADLACAIESTIEVFRKATTITSFSAAGDWMDEDDVRTFYKTKPLQAESVLQTAKFFDCPQRRVRLYEVLAYTSASKDEDHHEREEHHRLQVSRTEKAAKKPRLAIATGENPPKEPKAIKEKPEPVLNPAQQDRLKKALETMKSLHDGHEALAVRVLKFPDIPKVFVNNFMLKAAELASAIAAIECLLASGHGRATAAMADSKASCTNYKDAAAKIESQIEQLIEVGVTGE